MPTIENNVICKPNYLFKPDNMQQISEFYTKSIKYFIKD